mgnify:CR=1 FL=1
MTKQPVQTHLLAVDQFYSLLLEEADSSELTADEKALLGSTHLYYGRYLNPALRNYFVETVIPHIARATDYLSQVPDAPVILDLGCGLGMQSFIFANQGAKVVAVDIREETIALARKRKAWYEHKLGKALDVEFVHCDFRKASVDDFDTRFDCLFSMSAFSYITPLADTVALLSALLKEDGRLFLYESNATHVISAMKGSDLPTPADTLAAFAAHGFEKDFLYGGCALPGLFWKFAFLNKPLLHPIDNVLRTQLRLSINYILGMTRSSNR